MAEQSLDALVVTTLPNILYLTNFSGSSGIVVVTADRLLFVTDFRYVSAICRDCAEPTHECSGSRTGHGREFLRRPPWRTCSRRHARFDAVGFEAAHLSVARHRWLQTALEARRDAPRNWCRPKASSNAPGSRKDAYELTVLREAARRLSAVASAMVADVQRGRTEREVAMAIDWRIREAGFERPAFDTIVAAGPNAALAAREARRAKVSRRRPGRAGLWRRVRLILRRPDPHRVDGSRVGAGSGGVRGGA